MAWADLGKSLHAITFNDTWCRRCRRVTTEQPKRKADGSVRATRTLSERSALCEGMRACGDVLGRWRSAVKISRAMLCWTAIGRRPAFPSHGSYLV